MDTATFTDRKTGDLVNIEGGAHAFLPYPVPISNFQITPEISVAVELAAQELGRLDGHSHHFPDRAQLLVAPLLRKEAILSSRIEGTQTTFEELVLFEGANIEHAERQRDNREVLNYVSAMLFAQKRIKEIPLAKQLICETHQLLMAGTDESKTAPGQIRDRQVHIGQEGTSLEDARYVPPPPYHIAPLMQNFQDYIAKPDLLPFLVRLAILHYQFEAIHPFCDGNGRLGRLLLVLMMVKQGVLSAPMLYLSAYFERRRNQYNDLLLNISRDAQWEAWLLFFLRGVAMQARDANQRIWQLQSLRTEFKARLGNATMAVDKLVDQLFASPLMSNSIAKRVTGFSWQSARDNVKKLEDAGIIVKLEIDSKEHLYISPTIIEIVDAAKAIPDDEQLELSLERPPEITQASV